MGRGIIFAREVGVRKQRLLRAERSDYLVRFAVEGEFLAFGCVVSGKQLGLIGSWEATGLQKIFVEGVVEVVEEDDLFLEVALRRPFCGVARGSEHEGQLLRFLAQGQEPDCDATSAQSGGVVGEFLLGDDHRAAAPMRRLLSVIGYEVGREHEGEPGDCHEQPSQ